MPPNIISLLLGTENPSKKDLQKVYINSIMQSSGVDQITAKMVEHLHNGGSKQDLLDMMFEARRGTITAESFEPDTSILPPGIYPGQKLYYIHIETIGIGTVV